MPFGKKADIVLTCIAALFLFGTLAAALVREAGVELPWNGDGEASYSYLEGRSLASFPKVDAETIANGKFQTRFEKYVSDAIPLRDQVMLSHAAMQRACITIANAPLGYETYPTYFESDRLCYPAENALVQYPTKESKSLKKGLGEFSKGLGKLAGKYPDKRFIVVVAEGAPTSLANPAHRLVSSTWTTDMTAEALEDALGACENVSIVANPYSSTEDFYRDYFRTDHHWNILGASRTYNKVAEKLGLPAFDAEPTMSVDGRTFFGSSARSGLFLIDDAAIDTSKSFGDLTIRLSDGGEESGDAHGAYFSSPFEETRFYFYSLYYGRTGSSPLIRSDRPGAAVLVSDSYGFAMKRLLAENYGTLYTEYDLHGDSKSETATLASRIDREDVSDVVFVASTANYSKLTDRMPSYFDL